MHSDSFKAAFDQIAEADLPSTSVHTAVKLLYACSRSGHIALSWSDFMALARCTNKQASRRHLTLLGQAGIVKYHTNEEISVEFIAYRAHSERVGAHSERVGAHSERVGAHSERVGAHSERAVLGAYGDNFGDDIARAHSERVGAHSERVGAHSERVDAHSERVGGDKGGEGWMDGWIDRFNRLLRDPSLLPSNYVPPEKAERDLSVAMLCSHQLALPFDLAKHIATIIDPTDIYFHGLRYIDEREDPERGDLGVGALIHRLANPRDFPPQPPTERQEGGPFAGKFGPRLKELRWRQKNPEEAAAIDAELAARPPTDRTGEESERE